MKNKKKQTVPSQIIHKNEILREYITKQLLLYKKM